MDVNLTSEERAQILQTIEMFEVIAQTQPDDCQSLDILKEAYVKIGQQGDALRISHRLAASYLQNGLYSSALLECEGILSKEPDSPEVLALMHEIESRSGGRSGSSSGANGVVGGNSLTREVQGQHGQTDAQAQAASLMALGKQPRRVSGGAGGPGVAGGGGGGAFAGETQAPVQITLPEEDGNEQFAKFIVHHRICPEHAAAIAVEAVLSSNQRNRRGTVPAASLLEEVAKAGGPDVDTLLSGLIDATKFGYVSLEHYDIDRAVVRMLPEALTLGRLFVPFDIVSRTLMVAICNPFDAAAKEATHSSLDYHIQWYLAKPGALVRVLRDVYRLDARE